MKRVIEVDTKFYTFSQNNSGGYFEVDKEDGIAEYVIIEATSLDEAESKAERLFKDYSSFCECCGERWYTHCYNEKGKEEPMIYDKPAKEAILNGDEWFKKNAAIHYYDGTIEWIGKGKYD